MWIRTTKSVCLGGGVDSEPGKPYDLDKVHAQRLISRGCAVPCDPPAPAAAAQAEEKKGKGKIENRDPNPSDRDPH